MRATGTNNAESYDHQYIHFEGEWGPGTATLDFGNEHAVRASFTGSVSSETANTTLVVRAGNHPSPSQNDVVATFQLPTANTPVCIGWGDETVGRFLTLDAGGANLTGTATLWGYGI